MMHEGSIFGSPLGEKTFREIRSLVHKTCGIALGKDKHAMVSARVSKRMRRLGLTSFAAYLDVVKKDKTGSELSHLVDAISTNVTSFYRESDHFDLLMDVMKHRLAKGQRRFRFWSAACATGQEPYSMAASILEVATPTQCDIKILASDISRRALDAGIEGLYTPEKAAAIPPPIRHKYFSKVKRDDVTWIAARDELRKLIVFKRQNLSKFPYPLHGPFDMVFCRNVLIYFDKELRRKVMDEMHRLVGPGGYLIVGHAESLTGMLSSFETVAPSVYRRK